MLSRNISPKMNIILEIREYLKNTKKPLIVILGPTASGKTALSIKIAKEINGEILSTDSRQIYREMEIGTDAIRPEEMEGVLHHMLGLVSPDQTLTLAEYVDRALKTIKEIYKRGSVPMLVGGTGLYISAIMEGYDIPRVGPDKPLRESLKKEAMEKGPEAVYNKLKKLDHIKASQIHPNNLRYVIRALEILKHSPKNTGNIKKPQKFNAFIIGINHPREKLYERINYRVERQIDRGVLKEVKTLIDKGYDESLPAMSSLGVKEYLPYFKGEQTIEECMEILKRNTRRYGKRQMTWFRRYDNVKWLTPEEVEKITKS